jgi:hypothetical protein
MLRRVAFVTTDVPEELSASVIRVTRILVYRILSSTETSVLTRATRRNIPEDGILRSHRRANLKVHNSEKKGHVHYKKQRQYDSRIFLKLEDKFAQTEHSSCRLLKY